MNILERLSIADFVTAGIPKELVRIKEEGKQYTVWEYLGNDVQEMLRFVNVVLRSRDKFFDPLTRRPEGSNRHTLETASVILLISLCQLTMVKHKHEFKYPDDFPKVTPKRGARGFSTNYSYLVHFGLLGRPEGKPESHYYVTQKGFDFYNGLATCSEFVICNRKNVLHSSKEQVRITDFVDIEDFKKEPLWWENYGKDAA